MTKYWDKWVQEFVVLFAFICCCRLALGLHFFGACFKVTFLRFVEILYKQKTICLQGCRLALSIDNPRSCKCMKWELCNFKLYRRQTLIINSSIYYSTRKSVLKMCFKNMNCQIICANLNIPWLFWNRSQNLSPINICRNEK